MNAEVIYVCMNDDCPFAWRPSPGPCDRCGVLLAPAIVAVPDDKLAAAVTRVLPKLADLHVALQDAGNDLEGDPGNPMRRHGFTRLADEIASIAADLKRAKDGMP